MALHFFYDGGPETVQNGSQQLPQNGSRFARLGVNPLKNKIESLR